MAIDFAKTFQIAGAVLGAYGQLQTGESQAAQYRLQANVADYNAMVARFMGREALKASASEQLALRRGQRQVLGAQRAAIAQAGIGTGGSAADVIEQSRTIAELDALNLAYEGAARFRAALTQADLDEANAAMLRFGARAAKSAARIGATRSLLSGAASFFGRK